MWQKKHGYKEHLEIIGQYPGTNSVDSQGPTPGVVPNSWLTLDSPLDPFRKTNGEPYCSRDCIDIEGQLGYTYAPGSLNELAEVPRANAHARTEANAGDQPKIVHVSGINRAPIRGSFLVVVYVNIAGRKYHVGTEAVLSRWNVQSCANCQTHLEVKAAFDLHPSLVGMGDIGEPIVEIRTRDGLLSAQHRAIAGTRSAGKKLWRTEVS